MPVIIAPSHFGWWLKDDDPRSESHKMVLERAPDDALKIYPVKVKAAKGTVPAAKPAKRKISPEGIARIKAAQKARWAVIKAGKQ